MKLDKTSIYINLFLKLVSKIDTCTYNYSNLVTLASTFHINND